MCERVIAVIMKDGLCRGVKELKGGKLEVNVSEKGNRQGGMDNSSYGSGSQSNMERRGKSVVDSEGMLGKL